MTASHEDKLSAIHPNLGTAARSGASLDHPFSLVHPDPASHRAKFVLPAHEQGKAAVDLDGTLPAPSHKVDEYLHRMPAMTSVIQEALATGTAPFEDVSIVLVHHLTAEVLGTVAALRALGCRDIVAVFVGYNEDAEAAYRPDLEDLPNDEFRCFILKSTTASGEAAEGVYSVAQSFTKTPAGDDVPYDALDQAMKDKDMDFICAMRCLALNAFLKQLARAKSLGRRCLVIEDGGYMTPILNEAALTGKTIAELRALHDVPEDTATDSQLDTSVDTALQATMVGTVEHTRNGYDRDMRVNVEYTKLAIPAFTIAVSYLKTQVESDTVASSILNAVTSVLYSHGYVFKRRNALVFGSRGNIGRRMMEHLTDRLDDAGSNLIGCDLKVGADASTADIPDWQIDPGMSSVPECVERGTFAEFDPARVRELDVIIGITGGPTQGHPLLQVKDLVDWLLNGKKRDLYLASGSSKTDEYPEILTWMDQLLSNQSDGVARTEIDGHATTISKREIKDAVSGRDFGSQYVFGIELDDGKMHTRNLLFLNNLMPVNFLFYGVTTEVIDEVLSQIVSASVALRGKAAELPESRLYAVDFDRVASLGVYGSRPPAQDLARPLPAES